VKYHDYSEYIITSPNPTAMTRLLAYLATGSLLFSGCSEMNVIENQTSQLRGTDTRHVCASLELLQSSFETTPALKDKMASIEAYTRSVTSGRLNSLGQIEIPVVVNVLYTIEDTVENITISRIQSQIDALNRDFNATNTDVVNTPLLFSPLVADLDIQFVLAGVNRRKVQRYWWRPSDQMKSAKKGGIDATDPTEILNIWVVGGVLYRKESLFGYAQFPGGDPKTDGVVIAAQFFGTVGNVNSLYGEGRSTTHNVAHWMNLHDIWGVGSCGDDFVADTPQADASHIGSCPAFPHYSQCFGNPIEMTMNFMDETFDNCRFMFTQGQKARALAVFGPGGPRASFAD
jgi:hypothetical protein